jgi:hypothetical protein
MKSARETTAMPRAWPVVMTGARAATMMASRMPAPEGTMMNRTPAAMARAKPPMLRVMPDQPGAPRALASSHRCRPKKVQVAVR